MARRIPYGVHVETDEYGDSWHVTIIVGTQCADEDHAAHRCNEEHQPAWGGYDGGVGRAFAHPAWFRVEPFVGWVYSQSGGMDI